MSRKPLRALVAALACAALAVALPACGNKQSKHTFGKTEGVYLDAGPLTYQIQISRQLNPHDIEDETYLEGLPAGQRLAPNETWFGVFMRVQNLTHKPALASRDFVIEDTLGHRFRPIALARSNPFAYQPVLVPPGDEVVPTPGSAAAGGPIQGSMLLFKLQIATLANRPLQLHIKSPTVPQEEATVDLDV